jgi:ribonuclease Z
VSTVVHLLGTGAGASDGARGTTMLAFEREGRSLVVDCGGDAVRRLVAAGLDPDGIEGLVVTHEHPDHVAGFPLFIEKIWLLGRRRPLPVIGIGPALAQARRLWEAFPCVAGWEGVPEIAWREVAHEPGATVLDHDLWRVRAAPGAHGVPVIGIRVEDRASGRAAAYSCDTGRSDEIVRLARGAELLIHEANHSSAGGHTTFEEAGEVARDAVVERLVLVHLPAGVGEPELARTRLAFPGAQLGADGGRHAV